MTLKSRLIKLESRLISPPTQRLHEWFVRMILKSRPNEYKDEATLQQAWLEFQDTDLAKKVPVAQIDFAKRVLGIHEVNILASINSKEE